MTHQGGSTSVSISRRDFLGVAAVGALGCAHRGAVSLTDRTRPAGRPNIILIVSDDQGYADVGVQGCTDIATPHLDALAERGVRFTDGHVSCPVCSPTRAGLITGRYQQRFGWEVNPGPMHLNQPELGMPLDQVTLADLLRDAGYATGIVGKWHLGAGPDFRPLRRGFDEFYGFLGGAHSYLPANSQAPVYRNETEVKDYEYLTDAFAREAVSFIQRHSREPFFLFLSFNAVHTPLEATPEYLGRVSHIEDPRRRTYAAMLTAMDDGIGAVRKALRDAGLTENTLIFFHSDNGGPERNGSSNGALRGYKGQTYEGGIRVPFLVSWPAFIPAGSTFNHPAISLDVLPSAVAAAGGKLPTDRVIDGVNLLPYLKGETTTPPHDRLYWRYARRSACRSGNWKLVTEGENPPELYDLASDLGEARNLASEKPELRDELLAAYQAWNRELPPPPPAPARTRPRAQRRARRAAETR